MPEHWTTDTYAAHNEALRQADLRFHDERDRRYAVIETTNKAALDQSLRTANSSAEKLEQALKEYKEGANEWRKTVSDLIATQKGTRKGMTEVWGWIVAALVAALALWDKIV